MAAATTSSCSKRRAKHHHPPPPPPPKILHLPRLLLKKTPPPKPTSSTTTPPLPPPSAPLEALFQQERRFSRLNASPSDDDPWRLQVEVLRAECNYLRMDRDIALKRLERHRSHAEHALRSAVHAVASSARDGEMMLVKELQVKLERLQGTRRGSCRRRVGFNGNFDRKALVLRRRLQEMNVREMMPKAKEEEEEEKEDVEEGEEEEEEEELPEYINGASGEDTNSKETVLTEVEILRRKMDCMSKGRLERMEECGAILLSSSSPSSSTNNTSSLLIGSRDLNNKSSKLENATAEQQSLVCGGRCREVVARVMEEVKAETEQWGEMEAMLEEVREEMEDLRCARDFWERCALQSEQRLRILKSQMMEWKQRARKAENASAELRKKIEFLREELAEEKREAAMFRPPPATSVVVKSRSDSGGSRSGGNLIKEKEEKHVLFCRFLDENFTRPKPTSSGRRRRVAVLQDIGNHL